jgi:hypothetical protein
MVGEETKIIFAGSFEALKHGISPEGRDFKAETLVKIRAGDFDVPEKIDFCFLLRVNESLVKYKRGRDGEES